MDKKQKGLADNGDGEFILNESGTSVSTDPVLPMTEVSPSLDAVSETSEETGEEDEDEHEQPAE